MVHYRIYSLPLLDPLGVTPRQWFVERMSEYGLTTFSFDTFEQARLWVVDKLERAASPPVSFVSSRAVSGLRPSSTEDKSKQFGGSDRIKGDDEEDDEEDEDMGEWYDMDEGQDLIIGGSWEVVTDYDGNEIQRYEV